VLLLGVSLLTVLSGCQEQTKSTNAPTTASQSQTEKAVEPLTSPSEMEGVGESGIPEDRPVITLEETVYDFGEVGPGTAHTAKFKFTNTGKTPLVITRVVSCCGVATRGVKDGQKYAPGRGGVLEIDYRAEFAPGDMRRNLYIYSNDPVQSVVSLTIQAKIVRRVTYDPASLKLFLNKENGGAKDITLTSVDSQPFSVTSFRATADSLTADVDPAVTATSFVLKPKADLEKLRRNPQGQVRITVTHPECKEVVLLYDVLPEFTVTPPRLTLFEMVPGKTVRREIWILGNYDEDFEVESASSQKGMMILVDREKLRAPARELIATLTEDRVVTRYRLVVEITPPEGKSDTVPTDVLEVKIKGSETIPIEFRGFYKGS
jgi:hypothetical protein